MHGSDAERVLIADCAGTSARSELSRLTAMIDAWKTVLTDELGAVIAISRCGVASRRRAP